MANDFKRVKMEDISPFGKVRALAYIKVEDTGEKECDIEALILNRIEGIAKGYYRHVKLTVSKNMVGFIVGEDKSEFTLEEKLARSFVFMGSLNSFLYESITYEEERTRISGGEALGLFLLKKRELGIAKAE